VVIYLRLFYIFPMIQLAKAGKSPGPGSLMWEAASDIFMLPLALPTLTLQTATSGSTRSARENR